MPSRREFLQTGAAVSAIGVNGVIPGAAGAIAGLPAPAALGWALYDDRYDEGRRFAAVAAAQGVQAHALDDGDITRFWYDELETLGQREPVAIAGFTQFGPMLVVERFAAERGMQQVLRVEHRCAADGMLSHLCSGPRETLALAADFGALHTDWPGLMAALACRVGADDSPRRSATLGTPGSAPQRLPRPEPTASPIHYYTPHAVQQGYGPALDGSLYSWVVSPRVGGPG
jgi:hypothetical protein